MNMISVNGLPGSLRDLTPFSLKRDSSVTSMSSLLSNLSTTTPRRDLQETPWTAFFAREVRIIASIKPNNTAQFMISLQRLKRFVQADTFTYRSAETKTEGKTCLLNLWNVLLSALQAFEDKGEQHPNAGKLFECIGWIMNRYEFNLIHLLPDKHEPHQHRPGEDNPRVVLKDCAEVDVETLQRYRHILCETMAYVLEGARKAELGRDVVNSAFRFTAAVLVKFLFCFPSSAPLVLPAILPCHQQVFSHTDELFLPQKVFPSVHNEGIDASVASTNSLNSWDNPENEYNTSLTRTRPLSTEDASNTTAVGRSSMHIDSVVSSLNSSFSSTGNLAFASSANRLHHSVHHLSDSSSEAGSIEGEPLPMGMDHAFFTDAQLSDHDDEASDTSQDGLENRDESLSPQQLLRLSPSALSCGVEDVLPPFMIGMGGLDGPNTDGPNEGEFSMAGVKAVDGCSSAHGSGGPHLKQQQQQQQAADPSNANNNTNAAAAAWNLKLVLADVDRMIARQVQKQSAAVSQSMWFFANNPSFFQWFAFEDAKERDLLKLHAVLRRKKNVVFAGDEDTFRPIAPFDASSSSITLFDIASAPVSPVAKSRFPSDGSSPSDASATSTLTGPASTAIATTSPSPSPTSSSPFSRVADLLQSLTFSRFYFFHFVMALQEHIRKSVHGPVQWGLVPAYWLCVKAFLLQASLVSLTDQSMPQRHCQSELVAANPDLIAFLLRVTIPLINVHVKPAIEMFFNVVDNWIVSYGEPLSTALPEDFCHASLFAAILICFQAEPFQVLLKALTFVFTHSGRYYGRARRELFDCLIFNHETFFKLFLHWCPEVRRVFHYMLVFKIRRFCPHSGGLSCIMCENSSSLREHSSFTGSLFADAPLFGGGDARNQINRLNGPATNETESSNASTWSRWLPSIVQSSIATVSQAFKLTTGSDLADLKDIVLSSIGAGKDENVNFFRNGAATKEASASLVSNSSHSVLSQMNIDSLEPSDPSLKCCTLVTTPETPSEIQLDNDLHDQLLACLSLIQAQLDTHSNKETNSKPVTHFPAHMLAYAKRALQEYEDHKKMHRRLQSVVRRQAGEMVIPELCFDINPVGGRFPRGAID